MIIADERWLKLMQPSNDWSVGFVISIYNIGCVIGAMTTGFFADACGRERTIALASTVFIIGALIQAGSYTIAQIVSSKPAPFAEKMICENEADSYQTRASVVGSSD